jgi:DNA polymerase-3 subunit epsilon
MENVLPEFIQYCGDAILIGHFIHLDLHFLHQTTKKELNGIMANPFLDTMIMTKAFKEFKGRKHSRCFNSSTSLVLDDLTTEFNLPRFKPHNALEDALQTAYLFLYLIKKMQAFGINTFQDVSRLNQLSNEDPLF